ncbi:hypothetical protein ACIQNG_05395 [Streptomyces sp. NPDC091377]|uniref:hypothetical protein n=1 Tax=Streptomyces sp. NPDC091377 TaxID=3365995 RepID=UPI0038292696
MSLEHDDYNRDRPDDRPDDRPGDRPGDREDPDGPRASGASGAAQGPETSYDAMDALLAVLTEEPLSEAARADAGFMAEYRAATADVTALREGLEQIADTLAPPGPGAGPGAAPGRASAPVRPAPARAPAVRPRPRRRPFALVLGGLAAACAAVLVAGLGWIAVQGGGGVAADASSSGGDEKAAADPRQDLPASGAGPGLSASAPGYIACSRLVFEGDVTGVREGTGGGRDRITVDVTRWFKPARGERRITFPMSQDVDPRLEEGDQVLIGIPLGGAEPDIWTTGERETAETRDWIVRALPLAAELTCDQDTPRT